MSQEFSYSENVEVKLMPSTKICMRI